MQIDLLDAALEARPLEPEVGAAVRHESSLLAPTASCRWSQKRHSRPSGIARVVSVRFAWLKFRWFEAKSYQRPRRP